MPACKIGPAQIAFEYAPIEKLSRANRRLRKHSPGQKGEIAYSIETFGFARPIIADQATGRIIDGEAIYEAACELGIKTVPVAWVSNLAPPQLRGLRIALNKIAERGEFDLDALKDEVSELLELDIDARALGLDMPELDALLAHPGTQNDPADEPLSPVTDPVVRRGDLFTMASHRVLCGDALNLEDCARLMDGASAAMSISDPPYNTKIAGNVTKRRDTEEFAQASGEMSVEEFFAFLQAFLAMAMALCREGALVFSFMDWRNIALLINAAKACELEHINVVTWAKHAAGLGSFYRSQTEFCGVFRKPGAPHVNQIMLGKHGRHRTNLWSYQGRAGFGRGRKEDLERHPTPKIVAMIADAILDCTHRNDVVLDLFAGAGTTAIAAQRTGRRARLMEISPAYVEASLLRFRSCFGEEPVHVETGLTLSELTERRRGGAKAEASSNPDNEAQPVAARRASVKRRRQP